MALKPDRNYTMNDTDIGFFMNGTGDPGYFVVHDTTVTGSGAAMDDGNQLVKLPGTASGSRPAGLLLTKVVNYDLTRQHINWHRDETQIGGKVTIARRGWFVTNAISGTPTAGQQAYYNDGGQLSATQANSGIPQVGRFLSTTDADGYAKVEINIV